MPNTREKLIELLENSPFLDVLGGYLDYKEAADHLIANGVTVNEWISVKDRLPEEWNRVLVYIPHIDVMTFAKLRGGSWYATWDSMKLDHVSHWMPLPEPPKGE